MAIQAEWCSENPPVFLSSSDNACAAGVDALGRLCFRPPPPPQQSQSQPQPHHQQQGEVHFFEQKVDQNNFGNIIMAPMHPQQLMPDFSLNLAAEFEKQKLDLDRFICLQNERLRFGVQEQRKEEIGLILRTYEARTQVLLKHKEGEIRLAMKKKAELESLVKRLESEKQTWEQLAKEKEAMVASLSKTLERAKERTEDAESCCRHDDDDGQVLFFLDQGNEGEDQGQAPSLSNSSVCKSCNVRSSSVVFLPCKHLSSCKACETFLHSCPICQMPKKTIIPALL